MFAAFKMGLYFKLFITIVLLFRFASYSSQRAYPPSSIGRAEHFSRMSSTSVSPTVRLIVITQSGYSASLHPLLTSLASADYEKSSVALDVWMFASSTCNYAPLLFYPLAMAVFGPPRFDYAIPKVVDSVEWVHGKKSLIAVRSEPDWVNSWESNRGTVNETLVFVDATLTQSVSASFYMWLKRAKVAMAQGMIANAGVFSLDSVTIPEGVPSSDRAVLIEEFFPSTAVFSPTQDAWVTFLKWHSLRSKSWFQRLALSKELGLAGFTWIESLRMHPCRAWFGKFLKVYKERIVHPALGQMGHLVVRRKGSSGGSVAGSGGEVVHILEESELEGNIFFGHLKEAVIPERPVVVKYNGNVTTADGVFGMIDENGSWKDRGVLIEDVVDATAGRNYREALRKIREFGRSRGTRMVSFTLVTRSFLETSMSWLCNVVVLDITPPAMVFVASDEGVANEVKRFLSKHARVEQDCVVISMEGTMKGVKGKGGKYDGNLDFGSEEYWNLMLVRTILLRDILNNGVSILAFETDQMWLSSPMGYIREEIGHRRASGGVVEDYRISDMVVTLNSRNEVAGNFLYLGSSVGTRQLMDVVVERFFSSYTSYVKGMGEGRKGSGFKYIDNDQSLLTELVLQQDWAYSLRFPNVKYQVLNRELFVDGRWFMDFEDENGKRTKRRRYYTSESSLYPVVVNNNFIIGVEKKKRRAERFGLWFVEEGGKCNEVAVKKAGRWGWKKEDGEARVIELRGGETGIEEV